MPLTPQFRHALSTCTNLRNSERHTNSTFALHYCSLGCRVKRVTRAFSANHQFGKRQTHQHPKEDVLQHSEQDISTGSPRTRSCDLRCLALTRARRLDSAARERRGLISINVRYQPSLSCSL